MKLKGNKSVLSIVFYVVAILFAAVTAFAFYNSKLYIDGLVSMQGLVIQDSLPDVINFYVKETALYTGMTVLLIAAGSIMQKLSDVKALLSKTEMKEELVVVETIVEEMQTIEEAELVEEKEEAKKII